jgi:hypothetical protein
MPPTRSLHGRPEGKTRFCAVFDPFRCSSARFSINFASDFFRLDGSAWSFSVLIFPSSASILQRRKIVGQARSSTRPGFRSLVPGRPPLVAGLRLELGSTCQPVALRPRGFKSHSRRQQLNRTKECCGRFSRTLPVAKKECFFGLAGIYVTESYCTHFFSIFPNLERLA